MLLLLLLLLLLGSGGGVGGGVVVVSLDWLAHFSKGQTACPQDPLVPTSSGCFSFNSIQDSLIHISITMNVQCPTLYRIDYPLPTELYAVAEH